MWEKPGSTYSNKSEQLKAETKVVACEVEEKGNALLEQINHGSYFLPSIAKVKHFLSYLFILEERERARVRRMGEGERERESHKQGPAQHGAPTWGLIPVPGDHDLSQYQESDAQLTEPPRCPCVFSVSQATLSSRNSSPT